MTKFSKILIFLACGIISSVSTFAFYNDYEGYLIIKNNDFNYSISTINNAIKFSKSFIKARYQTFAKFPENSGLEFIIYIQTKEFNEIYNNLITSFKNDLKLKLLMKKNNQDNENIEYDETYSSIVKNDNYYSRELQKAIPNETQKQFSFLFFETKDTSLAKGFSFIKILWLYDNIENSLSENSAFAPDKDFIPSSFSPQYSKEIEFLEQLTKTREIKKQPSKKNRISKKSPDDQYKEFFFMIP